MWTAAEKAGGQRRERKGSMLKSRVGMRPLWGCGHANTFLGLSVTLGYPVSTHIPAPPHPPPLVASLCTNTKAAGGREGAKIARGRQHGRRADRRAWLNAPPPPTARRARQFRIYLATSTEPTYLMCPSSVWSFTMLLWRSPVDIVQMKVSRTSRFLLGRHLPRADVWG
jgi:hypothetical protein